MKKAMYFKKLNKKTVQCELCPHRCLVSNGGKGICGVRKNNNGILYSLVYKKLCSAYPDSISKKPFYHFLPGTTAFSIATVGCNLKCKHCQNSEISQARPEEIHSLNMSPEEIIEKAIKNNCKSIAYTFTEPTVFYEYMLDICKLAKKQGIKNVIVSNGFINPEPLKQLCKYIDAANIDLKSINNEFYREICGARVSPVLESLKVLKKEKVWLEVTNLIIPGLNDSDKDIQGLIDWIKENLGNTVLHFTAFYPTYKLSHLHPTPASTVKKARKLAISSGIKYVYTGNIQNDEDCTYCPKCGKLLVKRRLFSIIENNLNENKCSKCNEKIDGIWN